MGQGNRLARRQSNPRAASYEAGALVDKLTAVSFRSSTW